jgi:flagellar biosynthesis protein FlhF
VLLAGPAGTGKTTTLVKLAIRYGLRARLPLQILSLDSLRVGGWEQLAAYARIAGLPCELLHTPAALDRALNEYRHQKLLLIDTPGWPPGGDEQSCGLARWLAAEHGRVEVQLVLSAVAQPRANLRALDGCACLAPAKVIFTHLDEMASPGPLLETALRAALPVSFLADGQQVPEDLHEASLERLLGTLAAGCEESVRLASAA